MQGPEGLYLLRPDRGGGHHSETFDLRGARDRLEVFQEPNRIAVQIAADGLDEFVGDAGEKARSTPEQRYTRLRCEDLG